MDIKALLDRRLVAVTGRDGLDLLDKLTSQDLSGIGPARPAAYTLLLTPQGKYLYDFFVFWADGQLYLDTAASQTDALIATLTKYKLRSDVAFAPRDDLFVHLGQSAQGQIAVRDPRAEGLGYRFWTTDAPSADSDYVQTLTRLGIIEPSIEMPAQAMPIEYGLQHMQAISFDKGCYMGQELTARMQHKGLAKHALIVAKAKDNQQLVDGFEPAVFDTQGTQIGNCIRVAHPYALLHVTRDAVDAPGVSVFEMQRSRDGAKFQLARN